MCEISDLLSSGSHMKSCRIGYGSLYQPWLVCVMDLFAQTAMKHVLDLAVKDSRRSWLESLFPPRSAAIPVCNSPVQPLQPRFESAQFSPSQKVCVKGLSRHTVSKLKATARTRMLPKLKTATRPRDSTCRGSALGFWHAPSNEVLSLCLPLEV